MSKYYIAYGSNMNLRKMAMRCPTAEKVGVGKLKNYELQFKGSAYNAFATISQHHGKDVEILLLKIEESDEKCLDRYEGYPNFYEKETVEVELENGDVVEGMVYVMEQSQKFGHPSYYYLQTIAEGYVKNGIDVSSLEMALEQNQEYVLQQEQEQHIDQQGL